MAQLLIIDDDKLICNTMSRIFRDMGHEVVSCFTIGEGLETAQSGGFDVVFLDVRLPDGDGISHLPMIQAVPSAPEVIIITGYADSDGAELAVRNNAWDYIKKPASIDAITLTLTRALQYRNEKQVYKSPVQLKRDGIIGDSPKMQECLDLVSRAAGSNANILIFGETGTGKELFARAIHVNSLRADREFVVVDCGSLPETLMESILFGHIRGAFTGADRARDGLIRQADGGTLFLDEIGELSLTAQTTLLRVLQERQFHPVGSTREIRSDFRLVAATNRNLEEMVRAGKFREDLLYRLHSITIKLPPVRERADDIKELVRHYTSVICESHRIGIKGFSPELFDVMKLYMWPGNVRELRSALEWAVTQALYEPTIYPKHLPPHIRAGIARSAISDITDIPESESMPETVPSENIPPKDSSRPVVKWRDFRRILIENGEREYLQNLMDIANGNIREASILSGLSQPRLYELLRKYGISNR